MSSSIRKLSFIGLPVLVIGALLAFGLSSLQTNKYNINFDENKILKKQEFLNESVPIVDSLSRPNIIVILADDLGLNDISLNGSQLVQTKHIDALAKSGVNCTNAYVTAPVCAPSRAGLITGRYQHRFGFENQMHQRVARNRIEQFWARNLMNSYPWKIKKAHDLPNDEAIKRQGIPPTEITLADMLKKVGYQTAAIGKWHLGSADYSLPNSMGFDYHYGFYQSHSLFAPENSPGIIDTHNPKDWTDDHIWSGQRIGDCAMYRNGKEIKEPAYLTNRFAEESIAFIEKNKDKPFFLYVPFSAPHTPLQAPESYYNQFSSIEDPVKRTYNAMIAVLDDAIGQILEKVGQSGLEENTLIFFLSDNGGAGYTHTTDNAPLNGGKITNFDGGLRVPFSVKWKGHLPEGKIFSKRVSAMDIFATSCAAANVTMPDDRKIDGVNLMPFLSGDNSVTNPHDALYWKAGVSRVIIKDNWKLLFDDRWGQNLLYDLNKDPNEKNNVAVNFPDIVSQLKEGHNTWENEMPPAAWPTIIEFTHKDENGEYYFEL